MASLPIPLLYLMLPFTHHPNPLLFASHSFCSLQFSPMSFLVLMTALADLATPLPYINMYANTRSNRV